MIVGLLECILLGWVYGFDKIRATMNPESSVPLGKWFDVLIKWIIPAVLVICLFFSMLADEFGIRFFTESGLVEASESHTGIYGSGNVAFYDDPENWFFKNLHRLCLAFAIIFPVGGAWLLTTLERKEGQG